jgi:hypothetical protein
MSNTLPGEFAESASGEIEVKDVHAPSLRVFLDYLYTDVLSFPEETLAGVMHLARMWLVDRVAMHCRRAMFEALSPENALKW